MTNELIKPIPENEIIKPLGLEAEERLAQARDRLAEAEMDTIQAHYESTGRKMPTLAEIIDGAQQ